MHFTDNITTFMSIIWATDNLHIQSPCTNMEWWTVNDDDDDDDDDDNDVYMNMHRDHLLHWQWNGQQNVPEFSNLLVKYLH